MCTKITILIDHAIGNLVDLILFKNVLELVGSLAEDVALDDSCFVAYLEG